MDQQAGGGRTPEEYVENAVEEIALQGGDDGIGLEVLFELLDIDSTDEWLKSFLWEALQTHFELTFSPTLPKRNKITVESAIHDGIQVKASSRLQYQALGITSKLLEAAVEPYFAVLCRIGQTKSRGIDLVTLGTETKLNRGVHHIVTKLTKTGVVAKRSVALEKRRVAVVHLSRFELDQEFYSISADVAYIETRVEAVLREYAPNPMVLSDIGRLERFDKRSLEKLRLYMARKVQGNEKCAFRVYRGRAKHGIGSARTTQVYCVELLQDEESKESPEVMNRPSKRALIDFGLRDSIYHCIQQSPNGLTSVEIQETLGLPNLKRIYKMTTELMSAKKIFSTKEYINRTSMFRFRVPGAVVSQNQTPIKSRAAAAAAKSPNTGPEERQKLILDIVEKEQVVLLSTLKKRVDEIENRGTNICMKTLKKIISSLDTQGKVKCPFLKPPDRRPVMCVHLSTLTPTKVTEIAAERNIYGTPEVVLPETPTIQRIRPPRQPKNDKQSLKLGMFSGILARTRLFHQLAWQFQVEEFCVANVSDRMTLAQYTSTLGIGKEVDEDEYHEACEVDRPMVELSGLFPELIEQVRFIEKERARRILSTLLRLKLYVDSIGLISQVTVEHETFDFTRDGEVDRYWNTMQSYSTIDSKMKENPVQFVSFKTENWITTKRSVLKSPKVKQNKVRRFTTRAKTSTEWTVEEDEQLLELYKSFLKQSRVIHFPRDLLVDPEQVTTYYWFNAQLVKNVPWTDFAEAIGQGRTGVDCQIRLNDLSCPTVVKLDEDLDETRTTEYYDQLRVTDDRFRHLVSQLIQIFAQPDDKYIPMTAMQEILKPYSPFEIKIGLQYIFAKDWIVPYLKKRKNLSCVNTLGPEREIVPDIGRRRGYEMSPRFKQMFRFNSNSYALELFTQAANPSFSLETIEGGEILHLFSRIQSDTIEINPILPDCNTSRLAKSGVRGHVTTVLGRDQDEVVREWTVEEKESSRKAIELPRLEHRSKCTPWLSFDGEINDELYFAFQKWLLICIMEQPGISQDRLLQEMQVLTAEECISLLNDMIPILIHKKKLSSIKQVSLFDSTKVLMTYYFPNANCIETFGQIILSYGN